MINLRAKNIFGEECFKISIHSSANRGAERIMEELKMGR